MVTQSQMQLETDIRSMRMAYDDLCLVELKLLSDLVFTLPEIGIGKVGDYNTEMSYDFRLARMYDDLKQTSLARLALSAEIYRKSQALAKLLEKEDEK